MSGPGANGDSYRCDACRHKKNRCQPCRDARAAYRRELQERKRADGDCIECAEPAVGTRCLAHQTANTERSGLAHAKRRKRLAKARKVATHAT
jgi:hypothetical protein